MIFTCQRCCTLASILTFYFWWSLPSIVALTICVCGGGGVWLFSWSQRVMHFSLVCNYLCIYTTWFYVCLNEGRYGCPTVVITIRRGNCRVFPSLSTSHFCIVMTDLGQWVMWVVKTAVVVVDIQAPPRYWKWKSTPDPDVACSMRS